MNACRAILAWAVVGTVIGAVAGWEPAGGPAAAAEPADESIRAFARAEIPALMELYCHLHAHPELSLSEKETAARIADEWRRLGFTVTTGVAATAWSPCSRTGRGRR